MRTHAAWGSILATCALALCRFVVAAEPPVPGDGSLSAEQEQSTFRLLPGLRAELVAAEPLIESPVAMAFDERGRLFVAENRGYPTGPKEGEPPVGRIALLEDVDGDGRMDRRRDFATGLTYPNGVLPWQDGLLVTCAPDVLLLRDTDDDGQADERRVLLTGFATTGSTQLRVSHPTLAIDNWLYVTSGLTGGKVTAPDLPEQPPLEVKRTDFRFRLDPASGAVRRLETTDGGAQFGLTFDDFGRRFICYNRVQVQHVVLPSQALRRNPHLAFAETVQNCPAEMLPALAREHGAAARLYPLSQNVTTADSHAGTFTAACGVTVWRGSGLPDAFRGAVFSCDPTGNLVHCDRLEPHGATFLAHSWQPGQEFLASTDNWFRPVFLTGGPDGGLYVVDMYRRTIEHPDYLPVEIRKRTDFESGKTLGRIWRVVRADADAAALRDRRRLDWRQGEPRQWAAALREADGWRRDTAFRLLAQSPQRSKVIAAALEQFPITPDEKLAPASAAQLLQLLADRQSEQADHIHLALRHASPGLRETAVQVIAPQYVRDRRWLGILMPLAHDPDPRVRFQAALALDAAVDQRVVPALAEILLRGAEDRWLRAAVFSSSGRCEAVLASEVLRRGGSDPALPPELFQELGRLLGAARPPEAWPALVEQFVQPPEPLLFAHQAAALSGLADGVRGRLRLPRGESPLAAALGDGAAFSTREALAAALVRAANIARHGGRSPQERAICLALLAHADFLTAGETLLALVDPQQPAEVQSGAIRALGRLADDRIAPALLAAARFRAYTPNLRSEVLAALVSAPQHLPGLLDAVESGVLPPSAIDPLRRRQLVNHQDPQLRERATRLLGAGPSGNRAEVYRAFQEVVDWPAQPENGRAVFKKHCVQCHRLDREGFPVGPDLFGIRNQPKAAILMHILVPEHEITPGFTAYVLETKDGRVLTGLVASETATSVTLRQPLGKEETVLRTDIEQLLASPLSLMPQELEKNISRQEFADLLAYLKGER